MDWETIIEALTSTVRDDAQRAEIYRYLMLNGQHDGGEHYLGEDDVFDEVWEEIAEEAQSDDEFIESISEFFDDQE
jgi:hypothetical protein